MKKATTTNKAFLLFTLFFIAIAALSFASFQKTDAVCSEVKKCSQSKPATNDGHLLWDVFSYGLMSFVSYR